MTSKEKEKIWKELLPPKPSLEEFIKFIDCNLVDAKTNIAVWRKNKNFYKLNNIPDGK